MSATKRKIVLKKLKAHNTIWHPESTLVFKSLKERLVIGKYVDDKLIPLDEEALDLCDKWKFKPDDSLLENDESGENDENGEDDESGENEAEAGTAKGDEQTDDEADEYTSEPSPKAPKKSPTENRLV